MSSQTEIRIFEKLDQLQDAIADVKTDVKVLSATQVRQPCEDMKRFKSLAWKVLTTNIATLIGAAWLYFKTKGQ